MDETVSLSPPGRGARPAAFAAGDVIGGRYAIVRFVAEGGMGEVYEAIDRELGDRVALKTVRAEIAGDERMRARLRREIQLARKVTHPNVCRLYDLGFSGEVVFLTMEFLAGETLSAHLGKGRLELGEARSLADQIAAGLSAAHRAGVVHGDLKPSNVMLVGDGAAPGGTRAVVTDFGLARSHGGPTGDDSATNSAGFVGTPAYMAPEQVEGGEVGAAADVYALGILLYRMVTGELPFSGGAPLAVAARRLTQPPPPPSKYLPDLDRRWERVILRCLERATADRFATVDEVSAALGGGRLRGGRWRVGALAAVAGVAAALAVAWGLSRRATPVAAAVDPMPRDPAAARLYAEGLARLRTYDFPAARDALLQASAVEPGSPFVQDALADAWWALGNRAEAGAATERAVAAAAGLPEPTRLLFEARRLETHDRLEEAAAIYRRLYDADPAAAEYGMRLADVLVRLGRTQEAGEVLARIAKHPPPGDDIRIEILAHDVSLAAGDFRGALASARRQVAKAVSLGAPAVELEALYSEATDLYFFGLYEDALRSWRRALAIARDRRDTTTAAQIRFFAGRILLLQGRLGEALAMFAAIDAGTSDPTEALANRHDGLGAVALARGDLAGARKSFQAALEVGRTSARRELWELRVNIHLGNVALQAGQLGDARARAERSVVAATRLLPLAGRNYTRAQLAQVMLQQGDVAGARGLLTAADATWRGSGAVGELPEARLDLARVELAAGSPARAEALAREALLLLAPMQSAEQPALANALLAEALVAQGRAEEAAQAAAEASTAAAGVESVPVRFAVALAGARARGDAAAADRVRAEAESLGMLSAAFEARLAAAEIERARGGRPATERLAAEASAQGLGRIAAAARALGR